MQTLSRYAYTMPFLFIHINTVCNINKITCHMRILQNLLPLIDLQDSLGEYKFSHVILAETSHQPNVKGRHPNVSK